MSSAELVLVCALSVLGRAPSTFPPIQLVDTRPPGMSPGAEAFVQTGVRKIFLLTTSEVFRAAQARTKCSAYREVRKLASVLIHEEWHILHPGDEEGAYVAQLTTLASLGLGYSHPVFADVRRSMQQVLARQRPDKTRLARADAGRDP